MGLFNIREMLNGNDVASPSEHTTRSISTCERFENMHLEKVNSLKQLLGRVPGQGEIFFLWTLNSFNAFTFITYVIKHFGKIKQLTFSTYSINERILTSLVKWYDKGCIERIYICISDSIRSRVPKVNDQLQAFASTRNIDIGYAWNHSKVTLIQTAEHHFVVAGSGNFSENALNEQYIFLNDEQIFNFFDDCIRNRSDRRE